MTRLANSRRLVVKIGSSLLVDPASGLKGAWLDALAEDIAELKKTGTDVLLVSSGAIALGRKVLDLPSRPLKLDESQAAAAVGQIELARAWSAALGKHGLTTGQILLTLKDTEGRASRRSYLNARDTVERLLAFGCVPVINENDTIATSEIRYGDNDRLAARVATMVQAEHLVLLSDIDGLYTAPPASNPDAELVTEVAEITPEIEAMAGSAGSELSRGGMVTKIEAAKIATQAGTTMAITSGKQLHPVRNLMEGGRATWFAARPVNARARKAWIGGHLGDMGTITIDAGAARALENGKSLLPAGVTRVEGRFSRGDIITIAGEDGTIHGQGLAGYGEREAALIAGHSSDALPDLLGYAGRATMVHRDDMALRDRHARQEDSRNSGEEDDDVECRP